MDYISYLRSMVGHERVIMVVAGALVLNNRNELLLQLRSDNNTWGLPGGYMEMGESITDTAKREVREETGLELGEVELFSIHSGPGNDKTLESGDKVALVQIWFTCREFQGDLIKRNEETFDTRFYPLDQLPENMFASHEQVIKDFLSGKSAPIIR
ncbi:NUDIX hydrolase [Aquibacillus kalidii]|uniref:NUDIX hydrolase n=1 Tax=Aquibacillus kalidii TaxID=2762597 RepID=UPI001647CFF0|nr:NUDIX domain-containing protein [Aquibacillus kalidii]